jgi:hypothetical protein
MDAGGEEREGCEVMTDVATEDTNDERDERGQASAALAAAIVRLSSNIGVDPTARVRASAAADLQSELTRRSADVLAADKARRVGGLH